MYSHVETHSNLYHLLFSLLNFPYLHLSIYVCVPSMEGCLVMCSHAGRLPRVHLGVNNHLPSDVYFPCGE